MDYKCRHCGVKINKGEHKTFGVCDNCFEKIVPHKTEKPINSGYPLSADGCVAMDERRYLSMIADIRDKWMRGSKPEIIAMEWMAKEIYRNFIITEKKASISHNNRGVGEGR